MPEHVMTSLNISRLARVDRDSAHPVFRVEEETITAPRCICLGRTLFPVLYASFDGGNESAYVVLHRYCRNCADAAEADDFGKGENNVLRGLSLRIEWRSLSEIMTLMRAV